MALAAAIVALTMAAPPAQAAPFPEKPITLTNGYGPGGGTDSVSRIMADIMSKMTKKSIIVQNVPGAGTGLALDKITEARPDGYTIFMSSSNMNVVKACGQSKYTYQDIDQLGSVNFEAPALLVNTDSPYKTLEDFITHCKNAKERVNVGTSTPAGVWHMGLMRFLTRAGLVDKVNVVPSTGGGGGVNVRLLGRHVEAIFIAPNEVSSQVKNKDFRMLAIASEKRVPIFPDVPTFRERGVDCVLITMRGFHAPKGLPADVREWLVKAIKEAAASQTYKDYARDTLANAIYMSPEEYRKYNDAEYPDYLKLLDETGLVKRVN
jgi:tripartite-type tricarboxylate transporter receptor subunit TctC